MMSTNAGSSHTASGSKKRRGRRFIPIDGDCLGFVSKEKEERPHQARWGKKRVGKLGCVKCDYWVNPGGVCSRGGSHQFTGRPDPEADNRGPVAKWCFNCGSRFINGGKWRSLECEGCGSVVAKTSRSATALEDRETFFSQSTFRDFIETVRDKYVEEKEFALSCPPCRFDADGLFGKIQVNVEIRRRGQARRLETGIVDALNGGGDYYFLFREPLERALLAAEEARLLGDERRRLAEEKDFFNARVAREAVLAEKRREQEEKDAMKVSAADRVLEGWGDELDENDDEDEDGCVVVAERVPDEARTAPMCGGHNDCWTKVFLGKVQADVAISLTTLLGAIRTLTDANVPKVPEPTPGEMCYICMEEICECGDEDVVTIDPDGEMKAFFLKIYWTSATMLHLEHYRYSSSGAHDMSDYVSAYELERMDLTKLKGYRRCAYIPDGFTPNVGNLVSSMIANTQRVLATDIAKQEAVNDFQSQLASMPVVRIRLTGQEVKLLEKECGRPVRSLQTTKNFSGHAVHAAQRELCRNTLLGMYDRNNDKSAAIHFGATMQEVKSWWANPGHDFLFHLSEDKDILRVVQALLTFVARRVSDAKLSSLVSQRKGVVRLSSLSLAQCMELLHEHGRQRFFFKLEDIRSDYTVAFFEDCLYDIKSTEFERYLLKSGARIWHGIMFAPDCLVEEFVPESPMYVTEQSFPMEDRLRDLIEACWPEILIVMNLAPGGDWLHDHISEFLKWLLKKGTQVFYRFVSKPAKADDLLGSFFGVFLEFSKLKPVLTQIFEKVCRYLRNNLTYTRLVWKGGACNGYSHWTATWRKWIHSRRLVGKTSVWDSEVREKHGEMWVLDGYRSTGSTELIHAPSLPAHKRTVKILDLFASYVPGSGLKDVPEYISCGAEDWARIINWGAGEPFESLSFGVMMTTVNRIRGGLSLGENVIVPPMDLESDYVKTVALTAYCELGRMNHLVHTIEEDEELVKGYQKAWKKVGAQILKAGVSVVTSGLAIPAFYLAKWLLAEVLPDVPLVKTPPGVKIRVEKIAKLKHQALKPADLISNISLVVPHVNPARDIDCVTCQMQALGHFSKSGIPEEGQQFILHNHENSPKQTITLTPEDMVDILERVRDARNQHREWGAEKVAEKIGRFAEYIETVCNVSQTHALNVHMHVGGPGVGKSTIIRRMLKMFESAGKNAVVGFPFKGLKKDYEAAEVLGMPGTHDFKASTFWYLCGEGNVDVLFLDEASSISDPITAMLCQFLGVKELYVVGDGKQTHLDYASGEGLDILNDQIAGHKINVNIAPRHTAIYDWRNPPYIVKLLNYRLGYEMKSKRVDYKMPEFLSIDEYNVYKTMNQIDREIVFSHAAANPIFGRESDPNSREEGANISVRSNQGKTFKNVAVGVSQLDGQTIEVIGMRCVAVSRHTDNLVLVARDWNDPVPRALKEWMCCDTDRNYEMLISSPWPDVETNKPQERMDPDRELLNRKINEYKRGGQITIEKDKDEILHDDTFVDHTAQQHHIKVEIEDVFIPADQDDANVDYVLAIRNMFELCAVEPFEQFGTEEVDKWLESVYWDPRFSASRKGQKATQPFKKAANGKWLVPTVAILEFCKTHGISFAIVKKNGDFACNDIFLKAKDDDKEVILGWDGAHLVGYPGSITKVINHVETDPWQFTAGKRHLFVLDAWKKDYRRVDFPEDLGHTPSVTRISPHGLDRKTYNLATEHAPLTSAWKSEKPKPLSMLKQPHQKQKRRAGTEAILLKSLVDPSDAVLDPDIAFPHATVQGVVDDVDMKVKPEGLLGLTHTKAGALKRESFNPQRSFTKGYANVYEGGTPETLVGCQRLAQKRVVPQLTSESALWAKKVAAEFVRQNFDAETLPDPLVHNGIVNDALKAVRTRNYGGRAEAERKKDPLQEPRIMAANKAQVKFKPPIDPMKRGQPLSMTNANWNLKFCAFFRKASYRLKEAANPDVFFDDYESEADFTKRLSEAIAALPETVQFLIVDAEKFDSQQGPVTLQIEYEVHKLLGASDISLQEYYLIRQAGVSWNLLGRAKGKMNGSKPSGASDTKCGNTVCEGALTTYKYDGDGPVVKTWKGDDHLRVQTNLRADKQKSAEIKGYTGLNFVEKIADSGSFIGYAVDRGGVVPDVVRRMYRVLASRARDYKHFTEQQKAVRNYMQEVDLVGGEKAAIRGAVATGASPDMGCVAYAVLNSVGHLSEKQWLRHTKKRKRFIGHVRTALGPTLL